MAGLSAAAQSASARPLAHVGVPTWSLTTLTACFSRISRSMVRTKFFPCDE